MPKLVDLIRHGQSTFNAAYAEIGSDPLHYDARLTPLGHAQVAAARETLRANAYELIVTSPFSRAIETTLGLFGQSRRPQLGGNRARELSERWSVDSATRCSARRRHVSSTRSSHLKVATFSRRCPVSSASFTSGLARAVKTPRPSSRLIRT